MDEPESKNKNKVWIASDGERPIIARQNKTSDRMLYAFSLFQQALFFEFQFQTVRGKFYRENVPTQLVDQKRSRSLASGE